MKLSTVEIPTIEMSKEEHNLLWHSALYDTKICGKQLVSWITNDGCNEMLLEGETIYRAVIIK